MDKQYTSNVESSREHFEEPERIVGKVIKSNQIWRDANLLPEEAPSYAGKLIENYEPDGTSYKMGVVLTFNDGATVNNLISYYENLSLTKVSGTLNCWSNDKLKNIILEDIGKTYVPKIYVNGNILAYELGRPIFDSAAGTLYFGDFDFAAKYTDAKITVSFYKYIGRMGTSSTNNYENADLPFRDTLKHFKDAENDDRTATFKVRGKIKNTNYILPPDEEKWYNKGSEDGGVVLLQETLEDTLWEQNTKISGGKWYNINDAVEVKR